VRLEWPTWARAHSNLAGINTFGREREDIMVGEVVVGVDETSQSMLAVAMAADEARLRHLDLRIVHVIGGPPLDDTVRLPMRIGDRAASLGAAESIFSAAVERARSTGGLHVTTSIMTGGVASALADASAGAAVLVLGRRSRAIAKIRSTAIIGSVIARSRCPVIVAQGVAAPRANVLAGVGTSPATERALAFAFEEASLRGTGLTAIHAWRSPVFSIHGVAGGLAVAGEERSNLEAARILSESLAGWRELNPDIVVRRTLPEGSTIDALVQASLSAQLLVVGARRAPAMRTSAIVHEVIRRALCPVAVIGC
jgi:Universal stress protein family